VKETAQFLKLIRRFWNCVNVSNPRARFRFRDDRSKPVSENDREQAEFLDKFAAWLHEWQNMSKKTKKTGLSNETFMAAQQTTAALKELSFYLLDVKGLKYVLFGLINSDPIERRFGWYRQLAGANYYLSVRQFLEAEKKIRLKCLVKFGKLSLEDVADVFAEGNLAEQSNIVGSACELLSLLPSDGMSEGIKLNGEEGIIFYVAGYIARSLLKRVKCESCPGLLVKSRDAPAIELSEEEDNQEDCQAKEDFLKSINRGGLVTPSELVCAHISQAFPFLSCIHPRHA
jgi:hypothetical protein